MKAVGARPRRRPLVVGCAALVFAALVAGTATGAPVTSSAVTPVSVTVGIIPIANTYPLDLGIKKGYFAQQGIDVKKLTLASGNDIMLALANNNVDIGFAGWVPAMIARTNGIPISAIALSEVEGTNEAANWQNILVKGSSSIRGPADLAGKTVAVNALKGVGEVMIRAALEKSGVDPSSVKFLALPFPAMRAALANGQVDAIWTAEPFLTQAITLDGARSVMAPGPILGAYWPIGGYFAKTDWMAEHPSVAARFRTAMNQALEYSQNHGDEVREFLPATQKTVRLPIWTTVLDRVKSHARELREEVRRDLDPANPHAARTELPRRRQAAPGDRREPIHHPAAGREARVPAPRREVLGDRDGHLDVTGLPSRRAGGVQGDLGEGHREDDLDARSQEGRLYLQLTRGEGEESLPGFVSQGCVRAVAPPRHRVPVEERSAMSTETATGIETRLFVGGAFVDPEDGRNFENRDPYTDDVVSEVAAGSREDARRAIEAARRPRPRGAPPPAVRQGVFLKAADVLDSRHDEVVRLLARETGCTFGFGMFQMHFVPGLFRQAAALAYAPLGEVIPSDTGRVRDGHPAPRRRRRRDRPVERRADPLGPLDRCAARPRQHRRPQAFGVVAVGRRAALGRDLRGGRAARRGARTSSRMRPAKPGRSATSSSRTRPSAASTSPARPQQDARSPRLPAVSSSASCSSSAATTR